ncbi:class I SAM-dependent methyltransferase [Limnochorda pilosa]|uniref:class I SAM-dependent methyltransferase n=1 Tax=Limnochorda pilosa TaxID=1555112 RepID=UPI00130D6ED1|nr:class I SAM-dependent methyltransferase [Limnochorda pilosa]
MHEVLSLLAKAQDGPEPAHLLELGCRTGLVSRFLARRCPAALIAVDVSEERLALASARAPGVLWLRRDPRYLSAPLPGAPFDLIVVHPWTTGAVRPDRMERWLRDLAALLQGPGAGRRAAAPAGRAGGRLFLTLYRHSQLAQRWGHRTGGRDSADWAWAWEARYDGAGHHQELHLMAFVPTHVPTRFARMDDVVGLHHHPDEALLAASRAAGLEGGEHPVARTGSLLLYRLRRTP